MGVEVWGPLLAAGLSTGAQVYNTRRTERKQDNQLAASIRRQSSKQREADARVNEEVQKLEQSNAADERRERLGQYIQTLQAGKQASGFDQAVGGEAFQADAAQAAEGVQLAAADTAGLMSREDAAGMQRQGEAFGFGRLATDIGRIKRESSGDAFIDELRLRAIRRNPWIDAAGSFGMGVAGAMAGGGGKDGFNPSPYGPYASGYKYPGG